MRTTWSVWAQMLRRGTKPESEVALANREAKLDGEKAINLQYTSGTTGSPKGA